MSGAEHAPRHPLAFARILGTGVKRIILPLVVGLGLVVGVLASPAAATIHPGNWKEIFGHSASCAIGRSSINDSTKTANALTRNHRGCSSSNAAVTVPANYLGARAVLVRASDNAVCGDTHDRWNSSGESRQSASIGSQFEWCGAAVYVGAAINKRKSDAGAIHTITDRVSPPIYLVFTWT